MRKKYFNPVFFSIFFLLISLGCYKKNEDSLCLSFSNAPVVKIEGSTVASANQEVILTVSFGCINGCGQFGNFDESITGNTTTIIVNAKYEGCVCTQDAPTRQTQYKFKKSQTGSYDLKFFQAENKYLTHTIIVQ